MQQLVSELTRCALGRRARRDRAASVPAMTAQEFLDAFAAQLGVAAQAEAG